MEIEIFEIVWDEINVKHIWDKQKIKQEEVEQAIFNEDRIATKLPNGRVLLIGFGINNRLIIVILSPKDTYQRMWYPITARVASKKDRRFYQSVKGGNIK